MADVRVYHTRIVATNGGEVLYAGHIPGRVRVGMATPASSSNVRPGWLEARQIIDQPIYEARRFESTEYNQQAVAGMLNEAAAADAYPVISLKYNDWAGVAAGTYAADFAQLLDQVKAWCDLVPGRTCGIAIYHEPAGDGVLADWARMQIWLSWFFAGRRGGTATSTYIPSQDFRSQIALHAIGNGFWWRTTSTPAATDDANIAFPAALISAFNANKHVVSSDHYDVDYVDPQGALTNASLRTPGTGVRTHTRILNFVAWGRAKGVRAMALGEFGVIDGTEMKACADAIMANKDLLSCVNYFNSFNNADQDRRLIPATYPAYNSPNQFGLVDFGGNAQSAGRLSEAKAFLTRSETGAIQANQTILVRRGRESRIVA